MELYRWTAGNGQEMYLAAIVRGGVRSWRQWWVGADGRVNQGGVASELPGGILCGAEEIDAFVAAGGELE